MKILSIEDVSNKESFIVFQSNKVKGPKYWLFKLLNLAWKLNTCFSSEQSYICYNTKANRGLLISFHSDSKEV